MAESVASVTVAGAGARVRRRRPSYLRADLALGSVIIGFWLLCALFPTLFTDVDPTAISDKGTTLLGEPLPPGSDGFPLGTDALGRDFLSRLVHGARVAMLMAVVPNFLALLLAMLVGVTAGMVRGKVEFVPHAGDRGVHGPAGLPDRHGGHRHLRDVDGGAHLHPRHVLVDLHGTGALRRDAPDPRDALRRVGPGDRRQHGPDLPSST